MFSLTYFLICCLRNKFEFFFSMIEGCPDSCGGSSKGQCIFEDGHWLCRCEDGWGGLDCKTPQETSCLDDKDNDSGLVNFVLHFYPDEIALHASPQGLLNYFNR